MPPPYSCCPRQPPLHPPTRSLTPTQTDIGNDRLRRLFSRLDSHGFVVRHEIRSMLFAYEHEHGLLPPSASVLTRVRGEEGRGG